MRDIKRGQFVSHLGNKMRLNEQFAVNHLKKWHCPFGQSLVLICTLQFLQKISFHSFEHICLVHLREYT